MKLLKSSLLEVIPHITQARPFSIHHIETNPAEELALYLHWHSEAEFLYISKGTMRFYVEDHEYVLSEGEAIFISPNLLHKAYTVNGTSCEFYAIVFSTTMISDVNSNLQYHQYIRPVIHSGLHCTLHLAPEVHWKKEILDHLRRIHQMHHENVSISTWELYMNGALLMIWQSLYNHHLSRIQIKMDDKKLALQLGASVDYIHEYYSNDITLKGLAELSHLSEGQFCRSFKQMTGFTPFSYISRYRIMKSCEYLQTSSKKVTEIALLSGYNNISFFNREFTKYIRVTPSQYRKESQGYDLEDKENCRL